MSRLSVFPLCAAAAAVHKSIAAEKKEKKKRVPATLSPSPQKSLEVCAVGTAGVHLEMFPPGGTGVFVDHKGVFNLHR